MVKKSENPKRSPKILKITFFTFSFCLKKQLPKKRRKKCYPLSFPILGGCNSTRDLQSSLFQKYKNLKKSQKITLKKFRKGKCLQKKCYPLTFPILGGRDSTRALQSSLFQKYKKLKKSQKIFFLHFFLLHFFS